MKISLPLLLACSLSLHAALPFTYDSGGGNPNPASQGWTANIDITVGTDPEPDGLINSPGTAGPVNASPDAGVAWQVNDSVDDNKAPEYNRALTLTEQQQLYDDGFRLRLRIRAIANHTTLQQGQPWCGFIGLEFPAALMGGTNRRIGLIPGINTGDNSFQVWEQSDAYDPYPTAKPGGPHVANEGANSADSYHDIEIVKQGGVSTYSWYLNGVFQQTLDLDDGLNFASNNLVRFGAGSGPIDGGVFNILSLTLEALPPPIHVDADAAPGGGGTSWASAFKYLRDAIAVAGPGDRIWVAEGTYYPDEDEGGNAVDNDPNTYFALIDGVEIYGGFAGNESSVSEVDPYAHLTILSGDIDGDATLSNNAYHVVNGGGGKPGSTTILDGFTITGGNADGFWGFENRGGGLRSSGDPVIRRCSFLDNYAKEKGGGAELWDGNATLIDCHFAGNYTQGGGGGLSNRVNADTTLINCSFSGNDANDGGGLHNESDADPILINCSFSGNDADNIGGGIFSELGALPSLVNCLIWNNRDNSGTGTATSSVSGGSATYNYCLVQGRNPAGTGNLDGTNQANTPLFADPANPASAPTTSGNLRLTDGSPALNVGDNAANTKPLDLAGQPRIQNTTIDLGAYEGAYSIPTLLSTTITPLPGAVDPTSLQIDITFNVAVTGFDISDLIVSPTGSASYSGIELTGSGDSYQIILTGVSGEGSFDISFNPAGGITGPGNIALDPGTLIAGVPLVASTSPIHHVNAANPTPAAPYDTWATAATTLQDALVFAVNGDQVWVAAGTYYPDEGGSAVDDDRTSTFQLIEGVASMAASPAPRRCSPRPTPTPTRPFSRETWRRTMGLASSTMMRTLITWSAPSRSQPRHSSTDSSSPQAIPMMCRL